MPTPGASDAAGNVQPDVPPWDGLGYGENAIEVLFVDRGNSYQGLHQSVMRKTVPTTHATRTRTRAKRSARARS